MKLKVAAIVPWIALEGSHALDQAAKRLVVGDYNSPPAEVSVISVPENRLENLDLFKENPNDYEEGDKLQKETEEETVGRLIPTLAPSGRPSSVPSEIPTIASTNFEETEEFPTLGPSASLTPSDVELLTPSQVPSAVSLSADLNASAIPSLVPSNSDGPSDFPSLSPSLEVSLLDVSTIPSLVPSNSDGPSDLSSLSQAFEISRLDDSTIPSLVPSNSDGPSDLPSLSPSLEVIRLDASTFLLWFRVTVMVQVTFLLFHHHWVVLTPRNPSLVRITMMVQGPAFSLELFVLMPAQFLLWFRVTVMVQVTCLLFHHHWKLVVLMPAQFLLWFRVTVMVQVTCLLFLDH